jgi:excisionase family DNA binding protein
VDELLTNAEVARILGITPRTLENWRQQGRGPEYLKDGKVVRYERAAVERYIASMTITPGAVAQ